MNKTYHCSEVLFDTQLDSEKVVITVNAPKGSFDGIKKDILTKRIDEALEPIQWGDVQKVRNGLVILCRKEDAFNSVKYDVFTFSYLDPYKWSIEGTGHYSGSVVSGFYNGNPIRPHDMFENMGYTVVENHLSLPMKDFICGEFCRNCFSKNRIKTKTKNSRQINGVKSVGQMYIVNYKLSNGFNLKFINDRVYCDSPFCEECTDNHSSMIDEIVASTLANSPTPYGYNEHQLEKLISSNIEMVEKGMIFLGNQIKHTDILTRDKNGVLCIIELKVKPNDWRLLEQCQKQPKRFNEPCRMITICPDYDSVLYNTLKNTIPSIETKVYRFQNGGIVVENFD